MASLAEIERYAILETLKATLNTPLVWPVSVSTAATHSTTFVNAWERGVEQSTPAAQARGVRT